MSYLVRRDVYNYIASFYYLYPVLNLMTMLAITPSSNAHAALRYFRENLAQVDYYCEDSSVVGKWHGKAADQLGLTGEVNSKDFEALLFNVDPQTGDRLTARNSANRRPMYDFTFNSPKSVSVVHAITKDKDIIDAHQQAVKQVMLEVEDSMQTQMGSGKGKHYATTGNAIYAEFLHDTSRPLKKEVDGTKVFIPDPQIHSHCALINATYSSEQNRFRAVELGNVKAHAPYFESLYHSFLAENLKKSGYGIERAGKRWELAGVNREVIEKYSGRTLEIEERAKADDVRTPKQKAALGRLTRNDKNSSVSGDQLQDIWKDRLTLSEYHSIVNAKSFDPKRNGGKDKSESVQISPQKAVDLSLQHFLERNSGVPERRILAYAIDLGSGVVPAEDIKTDLASRDNLIRADYRTVNYITTKEMLGEEENLIKSAVESKNSCPALNPDYQIQNEILNQGQRDAVSHILSSNDQIVMVSGDAGVGKTSLLAEAKNGIEQTGKKVFAFAPSSQASREVLQSKGFEGAETIASLLNSQEKQRELQNNVMLVDEAGLVGIPTMNALFEIGKQHNARIILSGDYKQHSSVERGDATRILENKANLPIAQVSEIVRQRKAQQFKEIISGLAAGVGIKNNERKRQDHVIQAFDKLDSSKQIIEIDDRQEREKRIAEDYLKAYKNDKSVLAISPTHHEGIQITAAIRKAMKADGQIDAVDIDYTRLQSRQYTDSEKQLIQSYVKGDCIHFHKSANGFRAGQKVEIQGVNNNGSVQVKDSVEQSLKILNLEQVKCFDVFAPEQIALAQKDTIRITKNSKSLEGNSLLNGQIYQVKDFDANGNIQLSNGSTLAKGAGHFTHGYVSTSHGSQGKDAKTVLIAQSSDSFGASNDKQFYVSVTRAAENCLIYTDDKEGLRQAVSRCGDRITASEVAQLAKQSQETKVKQSKYLDTVKSFYQERIKPSVEKMKSDYERQSTSRKMGDGEIGLSR